MRLHDSMQPRKAQKGQELKPEQLLFLELRAVDGDRNKRIFGEQ